MSTPEPHEVREQTRQYLTSSLSRQIGDDEDIFAAGFVNSLFAAQLVMFVESRFGIEVENNELELAYFSSVNALTDFVTYKAGKGRAAQPCD
ncbi:phosphopantetheine-binding protein [Streptomyces sp. SL13]|jgi:methoxymalonate biosynthesis acyl carrier protein|uniref:Phosphopantetheine-binding protein n=1 Tax=Streptantibioticus silvisoli TaxID=2705255 RepID=A0AA90H9D7_9ACTN|nr:phosphopantetheine-binding protein [Streptantibioticus silvisoli]MDI5966358.1 phosphopantetheine-binding protein [Streptantibioticus silvisoli]MDI5974271.1 phosphopantetheine-binding protein [Streptantibioticus silvisoli]